MVSSSPQHLSSLNDVPPPSKTLLPAGRTRNPRERLLAAISQGGRISFTSLKYITTKAAGPRCARLIPDMAGSTGTR